MHDVAQAWRVRVRSKSPSGGQRADMNLRLALFLLGAHKSSKSDFTDILRCGWSLGQSTSVWISSEDGDVVGVTIASCNVECFWVGREGELAVGVKCQQS